MKPACGCTSVRPLPPVAHSAPRPQMHRPRQGCASLGSTERLLCSGSWSPDALIETLRPCRNQREGKGEQGRACKHIWHLQKPRTSSSHHHHHERNVQDVYTEKYRLCFPSAITHTEDIHSHTHTSNCAPTTSTIQKSNYVRSKTRRHNNSPAGRTTPEYSALLFYLYSSPNNTVLVSCKNKLVCRLW